MAKILIVDDSETARMTLKKIIMNTSHEIAGEAVNGLDSFNKYKEIKPDLVLMDIIMPESDGIEGLRLIKEFDQSAKIIMLTVITEKNKVKEAIKLGAPDYIMKPYKAERVLESIEEVLSR